MVYNFYMNKILYPIFIATLTVVTLLVARQLGLPQIVNTTGKVAEFSVSGEGKLDVVPDIALIDTGVTVNNVLTTEEAQKQMDDVNNKVVAALATLKIDKADIQTSNYSIYPSYSYDNNVNRITGYNGSVTLTIKVRDPKLAAQVISTATGAGANQINGARFTVEDPAKYREQVRTLAIANAKEQAAKLAEQLGIKLGKVTNMVESTSNNSPVPMYARADAMGGGGGSEATIEQGSQTLTSVVTLYFEKK